MKAKKKSSATVTVAVDFQRFCWRRGVPTEYDLSKPFTRDGYLYATDTRIIIRSPARGEKNSVGNFPDPVGLGLFSSDGSFPKCSRSLVFADIQNALRTRESRRLCAACETRASDRAKTCRCCGGKKILTQYRHEALNVQRVPFDPELLALVASVDGVAVGAASAKRPLPFRSGNVQGLVMPLRGWWVGELHTTGWKVDDSDAKGGGA